MGGGRFRCARGGPAHGIGEPETWRSMLLFGWASWSVRWPSRRSKCLGVRATILSRWACWSAIEAWTRRRRYSCLEVAVARRRTLILLVALGILAVTVACVPTCSWNWLPFGLGGGCRRGLDEDTLNRLSLVMGDTLAMQPGETWEFSPGVVECCYVFEPVDACATWSVSPTEGATIDAETAVSTVDTGTPRGTVFTVTADVENGRRLVSAEAHIYTPEANPLFGTWGEEAQFSCETGEEVVPEERIGELAFGADGEFRVTWHPFG